MARCFIAWYIRKAGHTSAFKKPRTPIQKLVAVEMKYRTGCSAMMVYIRITPGRFLTALRSVRNDYSM
jgi:hypothetical protein